MKLKRKLYYGNKSIEYSVIKSKRIKTSEIIVDADNITIRAPLDKPLSEIDKIIKEKASWILKKQIEYKQSIPQITKASFEEDSTLPYLGKNYRFGINYEKGQNKIEFVNGEFLISLNSSNYSKKQINSLYREWLMQKAQNLLKMKIKKYSKGLGTQPRQLIVKDLRNRWGSTTKDMVINLNVNLIKAPIDVIDYMVLHELCHLKIKKHSHHFWDLLHKSMPNYQEKIDWLKVNGNNLV